MRGEPLCEERRAVVGRAQHHTRRHRCRPPFGRESTRRCGSFFRRCAVDCGRSGGSSGRPVARGRYGRGSSVGRGRFFRRCAVDCGRSDGSSGRPVARGRYGRGSNVGRRRRRGLHGGAGGSVRRSSGGPGSVGRRGGAMYCRRGGAIHHRGGIRRIGAPFRRSRGTFRRRGAGRGVRFRGGERRAAQGFAPARRSGRPRGTRRRFDANRRAIRRRTIGFHGVVLFFSVNELGSGRALSGATPPKGCFSAVRRSRAARRSSARGARANPRGANSFARVPCREAFAEGRVLARAQILLLVRRVGRPSPRGEFLRGANSFARAPCRDAFAEGSVPARGKSFRPCAVSGGFRRGEPSRVGQILSLVRRVGMPSPRSVFLRG